MNILKNFALRYNLHFLNFQSCVMSTLKLVSKETNFSQHADIFFKFSNSILEHQPKTNIKYK